MNISTHTLTWSVTNYVKWQYDFNGNFNSHAHVERDCIFILPLSGMEDFNSHAHVERDVRLCTASNLTPAFQLTRSRGA